MPAIVAPKGKHSDGQECPSSAGRLTLLNLPPPPPGFRGLDPEKPLHFYRRHLPHWRQDGATYFVTFLLADALPEARVAELRNRDLKKSGSAIREISFAAPKPGPMRGTEPVGSGIPAGPTISTIGFSTSMVRDTTWDVQS